MSEIEQQTTIETGLGDSSGLSLGEQLRLKRKEKGMKIQDIAHHLKLDPALLQSFEEDCEAPHGLPEVYCKGFLRNYARYLGVEIQPGQITSCQVSELAIEEHKKIDYMGKRTLLPFLVVALVVVLWIVTGGNIGSLKGLLGVGGVPKAITAPAEVTRPATLVEPKVETAPVVEKSEPSTVVAQPVEESANDESVSAVTEAAAGVETEAPAAETVTAPESSVEAEQVAETPLEERAAPLAEPPQSKPQSETLSQKLAVPTRGTVTIRYIDRSWTQVTDGLGRVLVKRMLDAGAVEDFEGPLPLEINLGNAIGVRVKFNGEPFDHLNYIDDNNIATFVLGGAE